MVFSPSFGAYPCRQETVMVLERHLASWLHYGHCREKKQNPGATLARLGAGILGTPIAD